MFMTSRNCTRERARSHAAAVRTAALTAGAILLMPAASALAQTTVTLPDTSQTTSMSVTVSEQARVSVPATIGFSVTNVGAETQANPTSVAIDQIVLASATKQLRISLQANAASFTPPNVGDTTWSAADVSWTAASWIAATGSSGTLSQSSYATIATCNAGAAACSTTGLVFRLAAKPAVQRSGTHTLIVTWKVESIGS
jgi:hypothetical protein